MSTLELAWNWIKHLNYPHYMKDTEVVDRDVTTGPHGIKTVVLWTRCKLCHRGFVEFGEREATNND